MATFISLTDENAFGILINADNVNHIIRSGEKSILRMTNGDNLSVKETSEQITEMVKENK